MSIVFPFRPDPSGHDRSQDDRESLFEWLNQSGKPRCAAARSILNSWFERIPTKTRSTLIPRLTSARDRILYAAIFELFVSRLMKNQGFAVEHEPELSNGRCPDFRILVDGKPLCYVEATVYFGPQSRVRADDAEETFLSSLRPILRNRLPGVALRVVGITEGERTPSPRRIADRIIRAVEGWDRAMDDDDLEAQIADQDENSPWDIVDAETGWGISVRPRPLSSPTLNLRDPLGMITTAGFDFSDPSLLRDEIRGKLTQHRGADLPVVVAISSFDQVLFPEDDLCEEVLVGTEPYDAAGNEMPFATDGLWTKPGRTAVDTCPAVIVCGPCLPWALGRVGPTLWNNPFKPLPELMRRWQGNSRVWNPITGELLRGIGRHSAQILELEAEPSEPDSIWSRLQ